MMHEINVLRMFLSQFLHRVVMYTALIVQSRVHVLKMTSLYFTQSRFMCETIREKCTLMFCSCVPQTFSCSSRMPRMDSSCTFRVSLKLCSCSSHVSLNIISCSIRLFLMPFGVRFVRLGVYLRVRLVCLQEPSHAVQVHVGVEYETNRRDALVTFGVGLSGFPSGSLSECIISVSKALIRSE